MVDLDIGLIRCIGPSLNPITISKLSALRVH